MLDAFIILVVIVNVLIIMDCDSLEMMWKERPRISPCLLHPPSCPSHTMAITYLQVLRAKPLVSALTLISCPMLNFPEIPLVLCSEHTQNPAIAHLLLFSLFGLSQKHPSGLLQTLLFLASCFHACPCSPFSTQQPEWWNIKSDCAMSLLKTLQWLPILLILKIAARVLKSAWLAP